MQVVEQQGYLSQDRDAELRDQAPEPCRLCRKFKAKDSLFLDHPVLGCGAADERAPNGHLIAGLMLRIARLEGACDAREDMSAA